jgi:hypothetical protein
LGRKKKRFLIFCLFSGKAEENKEGEEEEKPDPNIKYLTILKLNRPEWCLMAFAFLFSLVAGGSQPVFAIIFADILAFYGKYNCAYNSAIQNLTDISLGLRLICRSRNLEEGKNIFVNFYSLNEISEKMYLLKNTFCTTISF